MDDADNDNTNGALLNDSYLKQLKLYDSSEV